MQLLELRCHSFIILAGGWLEGDQEGDDGNQLLLLKVVRGGAHLVSEPNHTANQ